MTDPLRWDAPWRVDARLNAQRRDDELRDEAAAMGISPWELIDIRFWNAVGDFDQLTESLKGDDES